jgi:tRNA U34 5-methylaminomethyl-2-thiouridine-forming methyltransferase MnmC
MKNPWKLELINTSDGSHTLRLAGADEQYHSVNGALQESMHVFINSGLEEVIDNFQPLYILEVGLGTGLNALLTALKSIEKRKVVYYDAIEPFPLDDELIEGLNYTELFNDIQTSKIFHLIHHADESEFFNKDNLFHIRCFRQKIQDLNLKSDNYHLVYFDAFGPDTQPEMWTEEIFNTISNSMKPGAVLVTYCAKGAVRRAMKSAGLKVEKLPGPPGKREITRAVKM